MIERIRIHGTGVLNSGCGRFGRRSVAAARGKGEREQQHQGRSIVPPLHGMRIPPLAVVVYGLVPVGRVSVDPSGDESVLPDRQAPHTSTDRAGYEHSLSEMLGPREAEVKGDLPRRPRRREGRGASRPGEAAGRHRLDALSRCRLSSGSQCPEGVLRAPPAQHVPLERSEVLGTVRGIERAVRAVTARRNLSSMARRLQKKARRGRRWRMDPWERALGSPPRGAPARLAGRDGRGCFTPFRLRYASPAASARFRLLRSTSGD